MKTIYHAAESRGHANHGWLNSYHTFSFANYYNPERIHFGTLRVLNDDTVDGNMGFGKHPHSNMEIISIPLEGDLKHADSMGNQGIISEGEIQVMSAGTGIMHSEMNANAGKPVKFLQIWVFPNQENVTPRYEQKRIDEAIKTNDFQQILSPNPDDEGVWIHQDAWFNMANFTAGNQKEYRLHKEGNGVYIFVIKGKAKVGDQVLNQRDGLGISETDHFTLEALEDSQILLMEVPMALPE
ncbi:pirin family protein [Ornithobacterium rhinotracheale]|uniref:Pirin family protein n=1 Tax=Ornithobacterium rhinotracheale TaxID=28251 RepID=A0A410JSV7_ORNRH|nr:pirin family protein [Ornithobacterium rhinotracheale]QAR31256.1 pirin family protein [Ornithobacterium rhinotracheale]